MQTFAAMNAARELKTGYADLLRMAMGGIMEYFEDTVEGRKIGVS